ncbi:hypothetical protein DMZ48_16980 [Robertkochia solimangrovi]|nr:hypothetical protein DMZ48_16980 [Robertkochia solimangrovi]
MTGLLLSSVIFLSCEKDNPAPEEESADFKSEAVTGRMQADEISLQIDDLIEIIVVQEVLASKPNEVSGKGYVPECVSFTTEFTSDGVARIVDFGEGCTIYSGDVISGKLLMEYVVDESYSEITGLVVFEDFAVNGVTVIGSKNLVYVTENADGKPQADVETNIKMTWPEENYYESTGTVTRVWEEGYESYNWEDNVFSVTGTRNFKNEEAITYTFSTETPLIRDLSCRYIISGILVISNEDYSAALDFGDGYCDSKATIILPSGLTKNVELSR